MISKKILVKFLFKYVYNPDLSFLIYFLFVALFAFSDRNMLLLYGLIFPWLLLLAIFINIPFVSLLFRVKNIEEEVKVNHVLEHGTIYFLKKYYKKRTRIGGMAFPNGFRIYGDIKTIEDIKRAFSQLLSYLNEGENALVLSKFCGSNIAILQGFAVIILTLTFIIFIFVEFTPLQIKTILLSNMIIYLLLRFPVGGYFQKKITMSFNFKDAEIVTIKKVSPIGYFEKNPIYLVETRVRYVE